MSGKRTFVVDTIVVTLEPDRCIKSMRCFKALPEVFKEGDPIEVHLNSEIEADKLIEAINVCPSGALSWEFLGEKDPVSDIEHPTVRVQCTANGPLVVTGEIRIEHTDGTVEVRKRASFCRCGQSKEKPFCDGSHDSCGFRG